MKSQFIGLDRLACLNRGCKIGGVSRDVVNMMTFDIAEVKGKFMKLFVPGLILIYQRRFNSLFTDADDTCYGSWTWLLYQLYKFDIGIWESPGLMNE